MRRLAGLLGSAAILGAWLAGCGSGVALAVPFSAEELERIRSLSGLPDVPPQLTNRWADHAGAASLGASLFFDERLSLHGDISCASCHDPDAGWSDGVTVASGLAVGERNTPSLWNTAYGRWWFWDGRADSLWAQALGPLESAVEMGSSRVAIWRLFRDDDRLRRSYAAVFGAPSEVSGELPEHATPAGDARRVAAWEALPERDREVIDRLFTNVGKALEAFQRRIVSRDAPFDRFVRGLEVGDQGLVDSLSASAQRGLKLFIGRGQCVLCHHGPTFSDGEFHNLGLPVIDGVVDVGRYAGVEQVKGSPFHGLGRFSDDRSEGANRRLVFVAQKLNNMGEFKTPGLRNVERTAPYMHDGRFATLDDVLQFYGDLPGVVTLGHREESLLPLKWTGEEKADLAEFLRSLTDESALERVL